MKYMCCALVYIIEWVVSISDDYATDSAELHYNFDIELLNQVSVNAMKKRTMVEAETLISNFERI